MTSIVSLAARWVAWMVGWLLLAAGYAWAGEARVAVAANMSAPMQQLQAEFGRATGHTLVVAVGATGKLQAQIVNGAPFDVLVSADDEAPKRLEAGGQAVAGTRLTYAIGRLVLWSATPGLVDAQGQVLSQGNFRHLALANPQTAPYGAAAVEVMDKLGLRARLQPRWVQGESVAQAWQFVASGNAELGFVAASQVLRNQQPLGGSVWLVPSSLHTPLLQDAVLLQRGRDNDAAKAFLAFLRSDAARQVLRSYGFEEPARP
ncbi:molybdate ABC transporter substrate-binding protein [Curvibacter sp. APW13]|uniref:molybdate ABC transporter substrate-binding protein n=1 Tax=Curvibacter sp. APW13 TaxID=3077236 RepID=UPI0028DE3AF7|nr:molybdate ABC transporter substrate-binding protein [Curvibacter sp. APW13]MDT8991824.1 molybdate ABC transporter substrate-binding protein [Curvibacter sp. APW13]